MSANESSFEWAMLSLGDEGSQGHSALEELLAELPRLAAAMPADTVSDVAPMSPFGGAVSFGLGGASSFALGAHAMVLPSVVIGGAAGSLGSAVADASGSAHGQSSAHVMLDSVVSLSPGASALAESSDAPAAAPSIEHALGGEAVADAGAGTGLIGTPTPQVGPTTTVTVTRGATTLVSDNDGDGVADPGDTIGNSVHIANTGGADATGVVLNDTLLGSSVVAGSIHITPIANDDNFSITGNTPITITFAQLLGNDLDPDGNAANLTITAVANQSNGSVSIDNVNHTVTFIPTTGLDVGATGGFDYTVRDEQGLANATGGGGHVTLNISDVVWYVDSTYGGANGASDGSYLKPFTSFTPLNNSAADADSAGETIFVYNHGTPGAITLEAGEKLFGDGHALSVNGITISSGAANTTLSAATGTVVLLATDNNVQGLTINANGAGVVGMADNNGSVTSASGTLTVSHVSFTGTGQAIDIDQGGNLAASIDSLTSSGSSAQGVQLSGSATSGTGLLSGSVAITSGAISGSTGTGFLIGDGTAGHGGTIAVSDGGTIAKTSAGAAVDVEGHTSGAVSFSGAVSAGTAATGGVIVNANTGGSVSFSGSGDTFSTGAGAAVNLTNNTGATISFTGGGLALTTTSGAGFNATGGGTVAVTGTGNTISSGSGAALNVTGTNIGATDLNFVSISANGGTKGIVLNTTGAAGGLHVTGAGTTNGSGGTIQNISVNGIELISTAHVQLANMALTNASTTNGTSLDLDISGAHGAIYMSGVAGATLNNIDISGTTADNGITGLNVSDFVMDNSTIDNAGNAANESGIEFSNLSGTSSISNTSITFSSTNSLDIVNTDKNLNLTLNNVRFSDTQFNTASEGGGASTLGEGGLQFRNFGSGTANIDVLDSDFWNLRTQAIQIIGQGTSTTNVDITNNNIDALHGFAGTPVAGGPNIGAGIDINGNDSAHVNFNVNGNGLIRSSSADAVNITSFLASQVMGRVDNNVLKASLIGSGVRVVAQETSHTTIEVKGNTITEDAASGNNSSAITGQARFQSARLDMTIDGNTTFVNTGALDDIDIIAGSSTAGETNQVYLDYKNNVVSGGAGGNHLLFRLRVSDLDASSDPKIFLHNFVEGGSGIEDDAIATWNAHGNTPTANGTNVNVSLTGTATGIQSGTVQTPTNPLPLMAMQFAPQRGAEASSPTATPATVPISDWDKSGGVAGGAPAAASTGGELNASSLAALVTAAIARWAAAGASADQLAAMHDAKITVTDMFGLYLGSTKDGTIQIDDNAAGFGWFIDPTPGDDAEFTGSGTHLAASAANAGRIDLLTALMHELGHVAGLGDLYQASSSDDVMYGYINPGDRRLPTLGESAGAVPGSVSGTDFALAPVNVGTLPAGKAVDVYWQSTIDTQANQLITNASGTSSVSGSNFSTVTSNTVTTTVDSLTLGNLVFKDVNKNGVFDAGDTGLSGVTVSLFADANNDNIADSATPITTTTTNGSGLYSFAGLAPGNYIVSLDTTAASLAGLVATANGGDPDNNTDNDSNGGTISGNASVSQSITLAYNTEPTNGTGNDTNNTLDFGFTAPNQAPVNTVPGTQTILEDPASPLVFSAANGTAISIADVDAGSGTITTVLTIADGVLFAASGSGATITNQGTQDATHHLTITGTLAQVNAALNGLSYQPVADANGTRTLTVTTSDNGNTGPGGRNRISTASRSTSHPSTTRRRVPIIRLSTTRTLLTSLRRAISGLATSTATPSTRCGS